MSFAIKQEKLSRDLYGFEKQMIYLNDVVKKQKEVVDNISEKFFKDKDEGRNNKDTLYNLKQEEKNINKYLLFVRDYIEEVSGYYRIVSIQFNKKPKEECEQELRKALDRRKNRQPVIHKI